jgi:shikimate dehydrogenase
VNEATELYGLVGAPISHSVSPAMHNAAFRASARNAVYLPLPAVDVDDFVMFARAFDVRGASITTPYKVPLFGRVQQASTLATRVGAINTVRMVEGRWYGENTDVSGFLAPLRGHVPLAGTRTAILGSGGAARGVAIALGSSGARVSVHARDRERARRIAELANGSVGPWPPESGSWDVLINCTPVGMYPHVDETPIEASRLTGRVVYDLVYNPPVTTLMREAARAGCATIGGLDMLVAQARDQVEWWTGQRPAEDVMREAASRRLAEFSREVPVVRA